MPPNRARPADYRLGLEPGRAETLRSQAFRAIEAAIGAGRSGFRLGDRLTIVGLARRNLIHRNTLAGVMDDLVLRGYLRRLPNKGFEVVDRSPDRPAMLTRHVLSLSEVAQRNGLESRSQMIPDRCKRLRPRQLRGASARVRQELALAGRAQVEVLCRRREMRASARQPWAVVAIEQTYVPTEWVPGFLQAARESIERSGDFSVFDHLRHAFPKDEFFKAIYEISANPLPEELAPFWTSPTPPIHVLNVSYGARGPLELTHTWFDTQRAVLLAGSLDVRVR